jgi:hypothetical protein
MGVSGGTGAVQLPAGVDEADAGLWYYGTLSRGWDDVTKTIFGVNVEGKLITYEDTMSICWKMDYVINNNMNSCHRPWPYGRKHSSLKAVIR